MYLNCTIMTKIIDYLLNPKRVEINTKYRKYIVNTAGLISDIIEFIHELGK